MKKILVYISPIWEGDDGLPSAKRILAIISFLAAIGLSIQSFIGPCDCIPNKSLIIGALFAASLALLGITSAQSYFTTKMVKENGTASTEN